MSQLGVSQVEKLTDLGFMFSSLYDKLSPQDTAPMFS